MSFRADGDGASWPDIVPDRARLSVFAQVKPFCDCPAHAEPAACLRGSRARQQCFQSGCLWRCCLHQLTQVPKLIKGFNTASLVALVMMAPRMDEGTIDPNRRTFGERMRVQDLCLHVRLLQVRACSSGCAQASERTQSSLQCGVMSIY